MKREINSNLININEAAARLSVSLETLRRWDKTGTLRAIRLATRGKRMYNVADIERFMKGKK